jgi:hypothetical protein
MKLGLLSSESGRRGRLGGLGRTGALYVIKPDVDDRAANGAPKILKLDQIARRKPAAQGHITLPDKPGEVFMFPNGAGFIPQVANCCTRILRLVSLSSTIRTRIVPSTLPQV